MPDATPDILREPGATIHKFGGTSIAGPDRLRAAAKLIAAEARIPYTVVVSSAMSQVTNRLLKIFHTAGLGDVQRVLDAVQALADDHRAAAAGIDADDATLAQIEELLTGLSRTAAAATALRDRSPRTHDIIVSFGERLAVRLLASAIRSEGLDARALDASDFLDTTDRHTEADPVTFLGDRSVAAVVQAVLKANAIPVITGFIGRGPGGEITTLGRGGSDFTATLVAAALRATDVNIWTDVPGVLSADPRIAPNAQPIPHLHYREAAEMSFYGAKVLHARTMIPVLQQAILVRVRSTLQPDAPGTRINNTPPAATSRSGVRAATAIPGQTLVSIEGSGMAGTPGLSGKAFDALAGARISATMISQASSEASVCIAVPSDLAAKAEAALKRVFSAELSKRIIEDIVIEPGISLVAAVGMGMSRAPGVAASITAALAARDINIRAIAQGSTELNVTLAVRSDRAEDAVRAIHDDLIDERHGPPCDVILIGPGSVGRAVAARLAKLAPASDRRTPRIVGVVDRSGGILDPAGLGDRLDVILAHKAAGHPLRDLKGSIAGSPSDLLRALAANTPACPILVDCSDNAAHGSLFTEALRVGFDIATANKGPLADTDDVWQELQITRDRRARIIRGESTIGAGLPVWSTITELTVGGDEIRRIDALMSGTIGFVLDRVENGAKLSDAVAEAVELGYTEPDPTIDLSGVDVGRKGLILGRLTGLSPNAADASADPVIGALPAGAKADAVIDALRARDAGFADRVAKARDAGCVLRYVLRIVRGLSRAAIAELPTDAPLAQVKGATAAVSITSRVYAETPLVVTGYGAGAEPTASGVVNDILRIAHARALP
ncbi:MAG: aspartate kinase [Planctomycetota bacterium]